ncbi:preprotein translocase subunit SecY [Patescibacteria group bacterium]|nr:preprotein translocase subunit SecY [Patescibacteria group bacterium]MDE1946885.1 preprotein translocase subunit SecY [Patescibacteria group bacterium]MDE2010705.1 preprotein translocase subunit SecY [Patescibacteria group bacterium]MDE2232689.1 preprotein translocase subunit SecY [Patescibacteria group bacterium]
MQDFSQKFMNALKDPTLRKRIGFTIIALVLFRVLAAIPIPGVDAANLAKLLSSSQLFGFFSIFSGSGLSNLSIVMLGVGPFITASIVIQLLTMMLPRWKALMHEEGEAGRMKLSQYSRLLSVPLALISAVGFIELLQSQGVLPHLGIASLIFNAVVITAGSTLLMWIGELISEFGVGNGVSLIIFAGIISRLPTDSMQAYTRLSGDMSLLPVYLIILAVSVVIVAGVVYVTEAERSVPITYAKQVRGNKVYGGAATYLPLRLNQAGVIPIIFALSIIIFPRIIAGALSKVSNDTIASFAVWVSGVFNNQWVYGTLYFILVVAFTYFYTAVTFDPKMISENLQRSGAFVPGVRPGEHTEHHLANIVTRITLVGALFLGIVAVLPFIIQAFTQGDQSVAIGGTALLIVVSVVIDLLKKIEAQVAMREY